MAAGGVAEGQRLCTPDSYLTSHTDTVPLAPDAARRNGRSLQKATVNTLPTLRSFCPSCEGFPAETSHSFTVLSVDDVAMSPATAGQKEMAVVGLSCALSIQTHFLAGLRGGMKVSALSS